MATLEKIEAILGLATDTAGHTTLIANSSIAARPAPRTSFTGVGTDSSVPGPSSRGTGLNGNGAGPGGGSGAGPGGTGGNTHDGGRAPGPEGTYPILSDARTRLTPVAEVCSPQIMRDLQQENQQLQLVITALQKGSVRQDR
jgi:hypothetical protein